MRKSYAIGSHPMTRIMRNADEERMASIRRNKGKPRQHTTQVKDIAYDVARSAYKPMGTHTIKEWNLVAETPTLKLYENEYEHKCVVGIRGTQGSLIGTDWRANYTIPFNGIKSSNRYKQDAEQIRNWKHMFPSHKWYGVAHSLGGVLLDAFIDDGLLDSGLSYNPAVQPQHSQSEKNIRIYQEGDPLYALMGKGSKVEKVKAKGSSSIADKVYDYTLGLTPFGKAVSTAYRALQAHNLTNFSDVPIEKEIEAIN
jgi:hypothetical protein